MKTETRAVAFLLTVVALMIASACTVAVSSPAGFPGGHQRTAGMAMAAGKDQRIERQELAESVHALALPGAIGMAVAAGKDQRIERQELAESVQALALPGAIGMAVAAGKDQRIERQDLPTLPSAGSGSTAPAGASSGGYGSSQAGATGAHSLVP